MFASNHHQVFRPTSNSSNNIENVAAVPAAKNLNDNSTSKTPGGGTSKTRRALGDISNRKQGRSAGRSGGAKESNAGVIVKKASSSSVLRPLGQQKQSHQQQQKRAPLLLSTQTTPGLSSNKRSEVAFLPRSSQAKAATSSSSIVNILPDVMKPKSMNDRTLPKSFLKHNSHNNKLLSNTSLRGPNHGLEWDTSVDDIEMPAGRLWVDQLELDEQEDSIGEVSLLGALTVREDWEAVCQAGHEYRLKMQREDDQRAEAALEDYEKKLLEEEGQYDVTLRAFHCSMHASLPLTVLCQFYDSKSHLFCFCEYSLESIVGAHVWIERTLSFDDELDEGLSFDAPSYCADISF